MTSPRSIDLRHLGDFDVGPRLLAMVAVALPIGALCAGVAWCLLRLIGLITNLVFYDRIGTALVAPGEGVHSPWVILLAPVAVGLVIGLFARFGSEKLRGHGIPEAMDSVLTAGSKVQPRVAVLKPVAPAIPVRLEQLLQGRLHDLDEERDRVRVLRPLQLLRVGRPTAGKA
jgi:hypothetical protein